MRIRTMLGVAVALLVAVGIAFAAGEAVKSMALVKAMGLVKSVDAEKGTLVVTVQKKGAEPVETTFVIGKDTKVTEGDAAKTLADLKAGQHVTVEYTTADGKNTASAVNIMVRREKKTE